MNLQYQLQSLQQIAKVACSSTNYQQKQEAENYFLEFCKNISSSTVAEILKNGPDNLIFVTIEYANKLTEHYSFQFLKEIFNVVESQISTWYYPESHQFRRNNANLVNGNLSTNHSKKTQKYVINSISLFLSNCMKTFFIQDTFQKRSQIVAWIGSRQNERYRLWLYSIFIENISQIDTSMGFIKFRTLSFNFQEEVVPVIAKSLIPFLYKVEDIMKVNQISLLQENLNVDERSQTGNFKKQLIFQNQNELKFAQLIFKLLHSLVFYNFHLTYTEYEQESTFDNCLISFPDQFTLKVVTQEFISSIGYVIDRLIDIMPKSNFLKITLQCLQKIFLTKLSYVNQAKKVSFIKECAITLTKILRKNNLNQFTLTKIMVCNNKFVTNIQISYFKEKQFLRLAFHQWLLAITKTTLLVLEKIELSQQFNFNTEDSLVIECLQLYQKIVTALCNVSHYSFEEQNKNQIQEKQYIVHNVQIIVQSLLKKILVQQSKPLIQGTTAEIFKSNIIEIKSFCSCFFQPFKQLASLNYGFFFTEIEKNMQFALQSQSASIKFNLFMLLTQVMDRNYLERNIITVKASDEEIFILSKCFGHALKFLQNYQKSKQQIVLTEQIILMDMSILIFLDKVLSQFLGYFQNHQHTIQIKHKIFQNFLKIQNKVSLASNVSEQFILFCIQSVLSYLMTYNKIQESKHINDFIFETINRILMKFKWGIKRQIFKGSQIYMKLSQFFSEISRATNIQPVQIFQLPLNLSLFYQFQKLKWRKKLLKVISLLYFDDIIDEYRTNLQNLFSALKNQHLLTVLLDIQGIGQAIDTISIYKTFLEMIEKYFSVQRLTKQMVHFASSFTGRDNLTKKYPKIKIIKEIIKMHRAVLSNKGQRIGNPKNMQSVYLIIKDLMGYWIDFLRMSTGQQWNSVVKQIILTITDLIKCDKINFYLVQRVCLKQHVTFFNEMLSKMLAMNQNIEEHPKFYDVFLQNLVNTSRELLDVLFFPSKTIKNQELNQKNQQICQTYIHLFLVVFKKAPIFLQQIKAGSVKNQNFLQKSLQIVKFTLLWINFKRRQCINYRQQMQQINGFVQEMKPLIFDYEKQILDYLASQKHFSVHKRTLIIIMYEGATIYPELMEVLIGGMNLPNYLIEQVKSCLELIHKQEQQAFIDRFKTWLRMIHMSEAQIQKSKQQNSDFYEFMGIL